MSSERKGLACGTAAYLLWGLFPLYWPLLEPAGAGEILASRIVWCLVFVLVVLAVTRGFEQVRPLVADGRRLRLMVVAAVVLSLNWLVYIWGVNHDHVVETSLGYFINPLVTVALGVIVLGERLRTAQWFALGLATTAVVELTVDYGRPPWIALVLAASFATYGLLKKVVGAPTIPSLAVETGAVALPALGYLAWLQVQGTAAFGHVSTANTLLLMGCGVVTAVPLLFFGAAAIRIPLTVLGLLQYLTPVMQFLIGVLVRHEPMPPARVAGFGLVWLALAVLTWDGLAARRRQITVEMPAAADPEPVG